MKAALFTRVMMDSELTMSTHSPAIALGNGIPERQYATVS